MVGNFWNILSMVSPSPSPLQSWRWQSMFPLWNFGFWIWRERYKSYLQIIVFCLNCLEIWKTVTCLFFIYLRIHSGRIYCGYYLKNIIIYLKLYICLGERLVETYSRPPKAWEEKPGREFFWETREGIQSTWIYWEIKRATMHASDKVHA